MNKANLLNFNNKYVDLILLSIIIIFSISIRLYLINSFPPNITGDESWDLSNIFRIIYTNNTLPLTLFGDGSVPAIIFYPVALLIKIFGNDNSIFFLRLNIIVYSLFSLIAFYYILKEKTSLLITFLFTLLLSANYVFLNFSRTAWVNMISIFSGLFLIYCIEKGLASNTKKWFALGGIFAGLSFYSYHYGRVLVIFIILYLLLFLIKNKLKIIYIKNFVIFITITLLISFPFILTFINSGDEQILRRPSATFAFSNEKISDYVSFSKLFAHQVEYTFRGLILLDSSITNEGIENSRYVPPHSPPVNILIKLIFIAGLVFFIFKKPKSIWWTVFLSILFTQFISDQPPNFSRALFYLPFIYYISAVFVNKIIFEISEKWDKSTVINFSLIFIVFLIIIYDINLYFRWMTTEYIYNARQPGLNYSDFLKWQKFQLNSIGKTGFPSISNDWNEK